MEKIHQLTINNYKSIKQIQLNCSRINVLIGKPNVGKSNILEALDLDSLSWFFNVNESNKAAGRKKIDLKEYFRVNYASDLFHLGDVQESISIVHPGFPHDVTIRKRNLLEWVNDSTGQITEFDNNFEPAKGTQYYGSPIHPYRYKENIDFHDTGNYINVLMPPFGNNLLQVIQYNPSFREFINDLAKEYGFEFNIDTSNNNLLIQLRVGKGLVYSMQYGAIADTLKRFIFYMAAIRHNNAHIITLEEPEVHSFPPFVSVLADEIIKATNRQFFIATHSPYLLNNLIENTPTQELAVFVCGYDKEKFATTVKKLSEEDLSELLNFGVDIFFNINRYEDDRVKHNS